MYAKTRSFRKSRITENVGNTVHGIIPFEVTTFRRADIVCDIDLVWATHS